MARGRDAKPLMTPLATEESWHRRAAVAQLEQRDYLSVTVGNEQYGIDIQRIREIIKVRPATEVPRAPRFILGVISVRGVVLPVLDLRERLRLGVPTAGKNKEARAPRILVVSRDDELLGLQVDEVSHVVRLGADAIEPTPPVLSGAEADFVAGIGRPAGKIFILLNLDAILRFDVPGRRRSDQPQQEEEHTR